MPDHTVAAQQHLAALFLLLVMVNRAGCASNDRCAYNSATHARYRSSHHCSSA